MVCALLPALLLQGKVYMIDPKRLPKAYATSSADNGPRVTPRGGAPLYVAKGFRVERWATGLDRPRRLSVAPNGDVFVAESYAGRISVLRDRDGDGRPEKRSVFATGLRQPYGIAFWPPRDPKYIVVGHTDKVVRYPYRSGDLKVRGAGQKLMNLPGGGYNQHWTRNVAFSPDGKRMFVTVGSASNADPEPPPRASILVANPDGTNAETYADSLRNPVGLAFEPGTGRLWTAVNERDRLGDDLVPDYVTLVKEGGFYGWPYFYIGTNRDPRVPIPRDPRVRPGIVPDVLLEAHCAALGIAFPPVRSRFKGAFVSMHGSWNRHRRSGYKIVRTVGKGSYEDFVWGFATPNGRVWGRPVDVTFDSRGALLFSDDGSGTIWRVTGTK
ncbi:sorbosone dehydrogenase family protein [bacterium]|nr:MAG: sorbosone dehydrogenase family protein [bacterium]